MNIHIVHLPHTFAFLVDLSLAYNRYGFSTVTLVANGFDYDQIKSLRNMVCKYSFIKILDIPTKRILSHGQALNYAFENSHEKYFCFADHDIFPTKPIVDIIKSTLQSYDVVCFGNRPENIQAVYKGFAASAIATQSGIPLATSFFSIYKRSQVKSVSELYKVGFEQYFRKSQIPDSLASLKDIQTLEEPFLIDTCKSLSLAMHLSDKTTKHMGSSMVCQLSGMCRAISRFIKNERQIKKEFIIQDIPRTELSEEYFQTNQQRHPKILEVKRLISDYSLQLLV